MVLDRGGKLGTRSFPSAPQSYPWKTQTQTPLYRRGRPDTLSRLLWRRVWASRRQGLGTYNLSQAFSEVYFVKPLPESFVPPSQPLNCAFFRRDPSTSLWYCSSLKLIALAYVDCVPTQLCYRSHPNKKTKRPELLRRKGGRVVRPRNKTSSISFRYVLLFIF